MGRRRSRPFRRVARPLRTPGTSRVGTPVELERCFRLVELLGRRWFGVGAREVAAELGVSVRTAYRYLSAAERVLPVTRRRLQGSPLGGFGPTMYALAVRPGWVKRLGDVTAAQAATATPAARSARAAKSAKTVKKAVA